MNEKYSEWICPECGSDFVHQLAISEFNQDLLRCQNCYYGGSYGDFTPEDEEEMIEPEESTQ